jgi:hypothetical protein
MTEIDLSPGRLDVRSQRGQAVVLDLEWPEDLTGRAFSASCGSVACPLVLDGTTMTLTIPAPATNTSSKRRLSVVEDGDILITGHWTPTIDGTTSPAGTVTVVVNPSVSVDVTVQGRPGESWELADPLEWAAGTTYPARTVVEKDDVLYVSRSVTTGNDPASGGPWQAVPSNADVVARAGLARMRFDVTDYGAVGDNSTDSTAAIQATIDAAAVSGGTVLIPNGKFVISSIVTVPIRVGLWGQGTSFNNAGTEFRCTTADAGIQFGVPGGGNVRGGPLSGNFTVNGNNIATKPLVFASTTVRDFMRIEVDAGAGNNITIDGAQNAKWFGLESRNAGGHGLVFDNGAARNVIFGLTTRNNAGYEVAFEQTGSSPSGAASQPSENRIFGNIIEALGTSLGLVYHGAGELNAIYGVNMSMNSFVGTDLPIVRMEKAGSPISVRLGLFGCKLKGDKDGSDANRHYGVSHDGVAGPVQVDGHTRFEVLTATFHTDGDGARFDIGHISVSASAGTMFLNSSGTDTRRTALQTATEALLLNSQGLRIGTGTFQEATGALNVKTHSTTHTTLVLDTINSMTADALRIYNPGGTIRARWAHGGHLSLGVNEIATGDQVLLVQNIGGGAASPITARGVAGQSGELFRAEDSTKTVLFGITATGVARFGGTTAPTIRAGAGTPEGAVTARVGSLYLRSDGGAGTTLYVKESGTGNTGWAAK